MGNEQMAASGFGSVEPTSPGFPAPVGKRVQQNTILAPSRRHQQAMTSQKSAVFAESLLDVRRGRLVHADMQHHGPLDGWLRGHDRLRETWILHDRTVVETDCRPTIPT